MSSTGRTEGLRHPDDFYQTPDFATKAILPHLAPPSRRIILDPCCGKGAILKAVREVYGVTPKQYRGLELDKPRADFARKNVSASILCRDALQTKLWVADRTSPLTIVMNPPFSLSMEFVLRGLVEMTDPSDEMAVLLRLNWLASKERKEFHRKHPSDVYVLDRRPSFAVSMKCDPKKKGEFVLGKGPNEGNGKGCGWASLFEIGAPLPERCSQCSNIRLSKVTSDSNDCGWYVWGNGRGNRWHILDT